MCIVCLHCIIILPKLYFVELAGTTLLGCIRVQCSAHITHLMAILEYYWENSQKGHPTTDSTLHYTTWNTTKPHTGKENTHTRNRLGIFWVIKSLDCMLSNQWVFFGTFFPFSHSARNVNAVFNGGWVCQFASLCLNLWKRERERKRCISIHNKLQ